MSVSTTTANNTRPQAWLTSPTMLSTPDMYDNHSAWIALDSGSYPHVAWCKTSGIYPIQYSYQTMGGWAGPETVSTSTGGIHPVIALDTADVPHVAWYNYSSGVYYVYYSCRSGGSWSVEEKVSGSTADAHYARMALDPGGVPHITWNGMSGVPYNYHSCRTGGYLVGAGDHTDGPRL